AALRSGCGPPSPSPAPAAERVNRVAVDLPPGRRKIKAGTARPVHGRRPMDIYRKITAASRKFFAAYPKELAAQLEWWAKVLHWDRVSLLRLLGLSAEEAARRQGEDLKEILKDPECEASGQSVEWMLTPHLSLCHYDWRAVADTLRAPAGLAAAD